MKQIGPKVVDLFACSGGFSLGFGLEGFDVEGVEIDVNAAEAHRLNVGPCHLMDVCDFYGYSYAPLPVLIGSPPCTDWSAAGTRRGENGETGALWREQLRIAQESEARVVLMENVRGFPAPRIAQAFERAGYHCAWQILDAADYGVPQHRDRVFLVAFRFAADRAAWKWPEPTHAPPGNLFGLPAYRTVREALKVTDLLNPDLLEALTSAGILDRPSTTVQGDPRISKAGHHDRQQNGAVRLGVRECALLQGFPKTFQFVGTKKDQHMQVGNAVPPPLAQALARAVKRVLDR